MLHRSMCCVKVSATIMFGPLHIKHISKLSFHNTIAVFEKSDLHPTRRERNRRQCVDRALTWWMVVVWRGCALFDFLSGSVEVPQMLMCFGINAMQMLLLFFLFLSQRSSKYCCTMTLTSGWRLKTTSALLVSPITDRDNARNMLTPNPTHLSVTCPFCVATHISLLHCHTHPLLCECHVVLLRT